MTAALQLFSPPSPPSEESVPELALQTSKIPNQCKDDLLRFIQITIDTDTMSPTLRVGDVVFVDCTDTHIDSGLFTFCLPDGPFTDGYQAVKRAEQRLGGVVRLMHDNKCYEDIDINPNNSQEREFQVIGRAVWKGCRV